MLREVHRYRSVNIHRYIYLLVLDGENLDSERLTRSEIKELCSSRIIGTSHCWVKLSVSMYTYRSVRAGGMG